MKSFALEELEGAEGYKLGTGLVVPRPIGWIGTVDADGNSNLAPYSFFNMVAAVPPTFVFSPGNGGRKDTLNNVRAVPEFTINIVTDGVVEAMNATAESMEADRSEFDLEGITAVASERIRPPRVAECRATIECVVDQIVPVGAEGAAGSSLVIGHAVMFHVDDALLDGTRVDQAGLAAVGRHAGNTYSRTHDLFDIIRPA